MRPPRGLTPAEQEAWSRLARTVTPLEPKRPARTEPKATLVSTPPSRQPAGPQAALAPRGRIPPPAPPRPAAQAKPAQIDRQGLDSSWEKKLKGARIEPDFTLDLHGATLDGAHARLDRGLAQAKAMGARLVLVVTGKSRPVEAADRGERRGAIRAKILDWLAAGPHEADIAAVRNAHRRHGGDGALYVVLRRKR